MAKEMLINVSEGEECRIALVEDGRLEELYMERTSSTSHVGNIYTGRVTNVEASIQAAFIDFGLGRNGFLHVSDLLPDYFGKKGEDVEEFVGKKMARRDRPPIQRCLRRGDKITVQVIKEGIGTKGPTLSSYLSVSGKMLVMMPGVSGRGVSRKIEDDQERRRLKQILDSLDPPEDCGFILRTEAFGKSRAEIERDLNYLARLWGNMKRKRDAATGPVELYTEGDLVTRTIRDLFTSDVDRLIVDSEAVADDVRDVIRMTSPKAPDRVEAYTGAIPLFHKYGIERDIELMYSRHVPLPSGGSLVIDSTEAVVAIDVNSGKFRDHSDAEMTAFKTDMEAADEICRQVKLRDLGGVIICDFIDLRYERNRRELEERIVANFKKDRAKTKVLRMSQFGIIEITRQRMRPSFKRSVYFDCPQCKGAGLVKTPESMGLDVMRRLAIALNDPKVVRADLGVCADVAFYLNNNKRRALADLEDRTGKSVAVRTDSSIGLDEMKLDLYDDRDGMVLIPELTDALTSHPHTTQLNVRQPNQHAGSGVVAKPGTHGGPVGVGRFGTAGRPAGLNGARPAIETRREEPRHDDAARGDGRRDDPQRRDGAGRDEPRRDAPGRDREAGDRGAFADDREPQPAGAGRGDRQRDDRGGRDDARRDDGGRQQDRGRRDDAGRRDGGGPRDDRDARSGGRDDPRGDRDGARQGRRDERSQPAAGGQGRDERDDRDRRDGRRQPESQEGRGAGGQGRRDVEGRRDGRSEPRTEPGRTDAPPGEPSRFEARSGNAARPSGGRDAVGRDNRGGAGGREGRPDGDRQGRRDDRGVVPQDRGGDRDEDRGRRDDRQDRGPRRDDHDAGRRPEGRDRAGTGGGRPDDRRGAAVSRHPTLDELPDDHFEDDDQPAAGPSRSPTGGSRDYVDGSRGQPAGGADDYDRGYDDAPVDGPPPAARADAPRGDRDEPEDDRDAGNLAADEGDAPAGRPGGDERDGGEPGDGGRRRRRRRRRRRGRNGQGGDAPAETSAVGGYAPSGHGQSPSAHDADDESDDADDEDEGADTGDDRREAVGHDDADDAVDDVDMIPEHGDARATSSGRSDDARNGGSDFASRWDDSTVSASGTAGDRGSAAGYDDDDDELGPAPTAIEDQDDDDDESPSLFGTADERDANEDAESDEDEGDDRQGDGRAVPYGAGGSADAGATTAAEPSAEVTEAVVEEHVIEADERGRIVSEHVETSRYVPPVAGPSEAAAEPPAEARTTAAPAEEMAEETKPKRGGGRRRPAPAAKAPKGAVKASAAVAKAPKGAAAKPARGGRGRKKPADDAEQAASAAPVTPEPAARAPARRGRRADQHLVTDAAEAAEAIEVDPEQTPSRRRPPSPVDLDSIPDDFD